MDSVGPRSSPAIKADAFVLQPLPQGTKPGPRLKTELIAGAVQASGTPASMETASSSSSTPTPTPAPSFQGSVPLQGAFYILYTVGVDLLFFLWALLHLYPFLIS